jgi:hypothetical protein
LLELYKLNNSLLESCTAMHDSSSKKECSDLLSGELILSHRQSLPNLTDGWCGCGRAEQVSWCVPAAGQPFLLQPCHMRRLAVLCVVPFIKGR